MVERGLYYATADFAQMIKSNGGTWNDTKHRPIVCLIKSKEHDGLYWAIPITDKYIDGIHVGGDNQHYIIKNKKLISELERKLFRILSVENTRNNCFRQHITDVKHFLLQELQAEKSSKNAQ